MCAHASIAFCSRARFTAVVCVVVSRWRACVRLLWLWSGALNSRRVFVLCVLFVSVGCAMICVPCAKQMIWCGVACPVGERWSGEGEQRACTGHGTKASRIAFGVVRLGAVANTTRI